MIDDWDQTMIIRGIINYSTNLFRSVEVTVSVQRGACGAVW